MHPNLQRLSHSSQVLLESCPRLYELDRLSPRVSLEGEDVHMDFGHLVGSLVQDYLVRGSIEAATWRAYLSYPRDLFPSLYSTEREEEKSSNKDFFTALHALDKFIAFKEEELVGYTVPTLNGKPAVELGFCINCPGGFQYRGKLDALLINSREQLACFECKTTGSNYLHEAMYRNSGQGVGYSAIVDAVASKLGVQQRESFPIFYPVYQSKKREWHMMGPFVKSKVSHANWIRHLLRTIQHIGEYAEDSYFPMHGQNCFSYYRACRFFEVCEMRTETVVGKEEKVVVKKDEEGEYPFVFSLDELIAVQMEKVSS